MHGNRPLSSWLVLIGALIFFQGCTTRDIVFTQRDQSANVRVLANDRFQTGDLPDVISLSTPGSGSATLHPDDLVTYAPSQGFVGVDRFTYTVRTAAGKEYTETVVVTVRPPYHHHGCNFSPYIDGQNPATGGTVTPEQLATRIEFIAPYCEWIRFFGLADDLLAGPNIAKSLGMKVAAGAWIGQNEAANQVQLQRLIEVARDSDVLIVGSEVLLRQDQSVDTLIGYINQVKAANTGRPVTTSEDDIRLRNSPQLINAVDILYVHIYPWWDGVEISSAMYTLHEDFLNLQALAGSKEIVIAETGWKASGTNRGDAIASLANEVFYHLNFASFVRDTGVKGFIFSVFDEPWKGSYDDGWGIWTSALQMKSGMQSVFEGDSVPNNWGTALIDGPGTPSIWFTHVPAINQREDKTIHGAVAHVAPISLNVVFYINVNTPGGPDRWWVKSRDTNVKQDGSFSAGIVSQEGNDHQATQIVAFLYPDDYTPPFLLSATSLPQELYDNSVAHVLVNR